MTCETFLEIFHGKKPDTATNAEIVAMTTHYEDCETCRTYAESIPDTRSENERALSEVRAFCRMIVAYFDAEACVEN